MKLYLSILNVVGVQRVVLLLNSIVLNMLLQHGVPVNQEPVGRIQNTVSSLIII